MSWTLSIYAKPNATDGNCIGAVAVGADVSVINENYNSKWAEILWGQAKKAKLTYSGILQNYDKNLTKAEFCRLAVNWYYLISSDDYAVSRNVYTISPADNPNICLDVWGSEKSAGAEIGLYNKNGGKNQYFFLYQVNGFTIIDNLNSQETLNGTTNKVYQDRRWYDSEKMTFEYNNDGTVCIINGDGLYLDIKDGQAVSGAHLMFAPKSGSSTQKWVFSDLYY